MTKPNIQKRDRVRSILNAHMTYRVTAIGPKRATLLAEGIGYYRCYAPVAILRKLS